MAGLARSRSRQPAAPAPAPGGDGPDRRAYDTRAAHGADAAPPARGGLAPGSFIQVFGGAIAWLSGSLAAIGAIFYAFGYLISLAQLDLLGVDRLALAYDSAFYVQRGARFLLAVAIIIGEHWWQLTFVLAFVVLGAELLRRPGLRLWTRQPFRGLAAHAEIARALAYLALLVLMLPQAWAFYGIQADLRVSGILFPEAGGGHGGSPIRDWILTGKDNFLQERYAFFVMRQAIITLLLALAWMCTRGWRWRALAVVPFALVFALSLVCLPLEYGKTGLQTRFLQISLRFDTPEAKGQPAVTMYLLNKTKEEVVLWDAQQRRIVLIPTRAIASAVISGSEPLSQIVKPRGEHGR